MTGGTSAEGGCREARLPDATVIVEDALGKGGSVVVEGPLAPKWSQFQSVLYVLNRGVGATAGCEGDSY